MEACSVKGARILGRDPERGALSQSGNRVGKEGKSWCLQESRRLDEEGRGKLRGEGQGGEDQRICPAAFSNKGTDGTRRHKPKNAAVITTQKGT